MVGWLSSTPSCWDAEGRNGQPESKTIQHIQRLWCASARPEESKNSVWTLWLRPRCCRGLTQHRLVLDLISSLHCYITKSPVMSCRWFGLYFTTCTGFFGISTISTLHFETLSFLPKAKLAVAFKAAWTTYRDQLHKSHFYVCRYNPPIFHSGFLSALVLLPASWGVLDSIRARLGAKALDILDKVFIAGPYRKTNNHPRSPLRPF